VHHPSLPALHKEDQPAIAMVHAEETATGQLACRFGISQLLSALTPALHRLRAPTSVHPYSDPMLAEDRSQRLLKSAGQSESVPVTRAVCDISWPKRATAPVSRGAERPGARPRTRTCVY
jgi:hypothetical protein